MNKKQKNRKIVKQNKRNRIINKRYISTIKTLSKLFKKKIKELNTNIETEQKTVIKLEIINLINNQFSIIDKAVKKRVIHKNSAARKKSTISKLSLSNQC